MRLTGDHERILVTTPHKAVDLSGTPKRGARHNVKNATRSASSILASFAFPRFRPFSCPDFAPSPYLELGIWTLELATKMRPRLVIARPSDRSRKATQSGRGSRTCRRTGLVETVNFHPSLRPLQAAMVDYLEFRVFLCRLISMTQGTNHTQENPRQLDYSSVASLLCSPFSKELAPGSNRGGIEGGFVPPERNRGRRNHGGGKLPSSRSFVPILFFSSFIASAASGHGRLLGV